MNTLPAALDLDGTGTIENPPVLASEKDHPVMRFLNPCNVRTAKAMRLSCPRPALRLVSAGSHGFKQANRDSRVEPSRKCGRHRVESARRARVLRIRQLPPRCWSNSTDRDRALRTLPGSTGAVAVGNLIGALAAPAGSGT